MSEANPSDNWEQGNPYERYIGRWSCRIAPNGSEAGSVKTLCTPEGLDRKIRQLEIEFE